MKLFEGIFFNPIVEFITLIILKSNLSIFFVVGDICNFSSKKVYFDKQSRILINFFNDPNQIN